MPKLTLTSFFRAGDAESATTAAQARSFRGLVTSPGSLPSGVLMQTSGEELPQLSVKVVGLRAGHQPGGQHYWVTCTTTAAVRTAAEGGTRGFGVVNKVLTQCKLVDRHNEFDDG